MYSEIVIFQILTLSWLDMGDFKIILLVLNSMFESVCHPGPVDPDGKTTLYFGSDAELCVLCPQPGTI